MLFGHTVGLVWFSSHLSVENQNPQVKQLTWKIPQFQQLPIMKGVSSLMLTSLSKKSIRPFSRPTESLLGTFSEWRQRTPGWVVSSLQVGVGSKRVKPRVTFAGTAGPNSKTTSGYSCRQRKEKETKTLGYDILLFHNKTGTGFHFNSFFLPFPLVWSDRISQITIAVYVLCGMKRCGFPFRHNAAAVQQTENQIKHCFILLCWNLPQK